jgi:hypothetical protein
MYLKGAKLQGARYGAVSPIDFAGLTGWWRASDGVTFGGGNVVLNWHDLSNNGLDITYNPSATNLAGYMTQGTHGLVFDTQSASSSSVRPRTPTNDKLKFILDGSPWSMVFVNNSFTRSALSYINILSANPNVDGGDRFNFNRANGGGLAAYSLYCYNATAQNTSFQIANTSDLAVNTNNFIVITYYGNNSTESLKLKSYVNNNLILGQNYRYPPNTTATDIKMEFVNGLKKCYELFFYNHTGKSAAQITGEMDRLYTDYLLKRYPNFI